MPNAFKILNLDTVRMGRFSDVVRGIISVRHFTKCPAYPLYTMLAVCPFTIHGMPVLISD